MKLQLLQYLCDRMEPPIPCELVRGYLDFMPHAWNNILVKRDDSWVRMVVDACHPHDIREETDPEYYCRFVLLFCYVFCVLCFCSLFFRSLSMWPYFLQLLIYGFFLLFFVVDDPSC